MMKLTVSMLIIAGLLCSCVTRSAVIDKLTASGTRQQGEQQPDRNIKRVTTRNAVRPQGKPVVTSHSRAASAQTSRASTQQYIGHGGRSIDAFIVTGNTRMPTAKIQSALKQYRGEHKTGTDISNAMRSVIDLYSSSGLNGAIITKEDHVVVLHVNDSGINAGTATGLDSGGRHYSTVIKSSPQFTATTQSTRIHGDVQPATFPPDTAAVTASTRFVIKGNHLVSTTALQQVLQPYTGKRFTRNELFLVRLSLIDLYESKGLQNVAVGLPAVLDNPVTLTIYENDIDQAAATTMRRKLTAPLPSEWVRLGWQKIGQGDIAQAMATWQQGVNRMPSGRLLAYIGVYTQVSAAIRRLKQIGFMQAAIILKAKSHGKSVYFVMSALHVPVDKPLRRKKLAGLRRAMGQHGSIHASSAGKFQAAPELPY